jgi:hypothetical protein
MMFPVVPAFLLVGDWRRVVRLAARRTQPVYACWVRWVPTKGAVFGKSRFYGVQRGPTSAGRAWLLDVKNVSVTPYTYQG